MADVENKRFHQDKQKNNPHKIYVCWYIYIKHTLNVDVQQI